MAYFAVAYPELTDNDWQWLQEIRRQNDSLYNVIAPHLTLVFGISEFVKEDFIVEVKRQLAGARSITFCFKCCTVNKDAFSEKYYAFLVPDEGLNNLIKLHDKLYSDKFIQHHRKDIEYIPHISLADSQDKLLIKQLVDRVNNSTVEINGKVTSVDIVYYDGSSLTNIEKIKLID